MGINVQFFLKDDFFRSAAHWFEAWILICLLDQSEPGFDLLRRSFRISALGSPLLDGDGVRLQQLGHDQCLDNAF